MRRIAAGFGVAAALAAGLALSAVPAAAHSSLIGSTPEDGAILDETPVEVVLEFDSDIQPDFTQVAVLDADENHYEDGEPESAGSTVTQPVTDMPAGEYSVSYRVGSADGHPVTGSVSFTVDSSADGAAAEATDESAGSATTGSATAGADSEDGTPTEGVVAAMAAVAVAGIAGVLLLRRRPGTAGDDEATPSGQ